MAITLTDAEIDILIHESKSLPENYLARLVTRPKRGHKERELDVVGEAGSTFQLILRESLINPLDFSVILGYILPKSTTLFRLRRYNGKSHEHTNSLESNTFYDFHVHRATERYQDAGFREDSFAEPTSRYQDYQGALSCLIVDCGFVIPDGDQTDLCEGGYQ